MSDIYPSTKIRPYVYFGFNPITGEFYIGYREANSVPSHIDLFEYRTSSESAKSMFDQMIWIILAEFETGDDAYDFEQQLIYENWDNPLLLNESCYYGKKRFKADINRFTASQFIEKAVLKHNNQYRYENILYKNAHTHIDITCLIHGKWSQTPMDHLAGYGCPQCGNMLKGIKKKESSFIKFLTAAKKNNSDKSYDVSTYIAMTVPMKITCPKHGDFWQCPSVHSRNWGGCPGCKSNTLKLRHLKNRLNKTKVDK